MIASLPGFDELTALAGLEIVSVGQTNGWTVDQWTMSPASLAALGELYRSLLMAGGVEPEIVAALASKGVDVEQLFYDERDTDQRHRTTRADLCELSAAAAWVARNDWPTETLHMPNAPKGSRDRSESGIDVMSVLLDERADGDAPTPTEILYVGSVKHTISDVGDLRRKLQHSVAADGEMTRAYVAQQLRVLCGQLNLRGISCPRLWLFLSEDFETSTSIEVAMTAGVNADPVDGVVAEFNKLPTVGTNRACRLLLIENISELHELGAFDA